MTAQFSLAVGGRSVEVEGVLNDGVFPLRLDYEAPDAPHFMPNPNGREGGWLNASVTLDENSTSEKDGWLVYNDADADDGVGGYMPVLRAARKPSDGTVSTAVAADPASLQAIAMAVAAAGASKANEYCAVITAMDLLGNESRLPKKDAACVAHDAYVGGTDAAPTYAAGLLAGVDLTAPAIRFSPASPKADDNVLREFQMQVADAASGIRAEKPVVAEASRRDAKETKKVDVTVSAELPLPTTSGLDSSAAVGYYTLTAHTVDKSGNASGKITRTALNDTARPWCCKPWVRTTRRRAATPSSRG